MTVGQITTQNTLPATFYIKIKDDVTLTVSGTGNSDISYANLIQAGGWTTVEPTLQILNGTLTDTAANFNTGLGAPRLAIIIDDDAVWDEGDPNATVLKTMYATNVDITLGTSTWDTPGTLNVLASNTCCSRLAEKQRLVPRVEPCNGQGPR